jgi:hypothetical protein
MWTQEITDVMMEFQPGKVFPIQKRAFVHEDGTRVDCVGGQERGFLKFSYKGQGIEFEMLGRLVRPVPAAGDLIFTLDPTPCDPVSRFVARGKLHHDDIAKIPKMKQDIADAFGLLPLWLHLEPELSTRPIKLVFHKNFDP